MSNTPWGTGWIESIRRIIRDEKVDLVNAHAPVPLFADAARRAVGDLPFVLTYHAGRMRKGKAIQDLTCALYERTVLAATARRADEIICASSHVVAEFPTLFGGRQTTIEPGADLEIFRPAPLTGEPRIIFAGSLASAASYKGLPDLLNAVARLRSTIPALRLEVAGTGTAEPHYRKLAGELGIGDAVTFSGNLAGADLAEAYKRARVLALPTHFDNFPTVIVEAMATARPVVATRVGAIPTLVSDGETGFLVEPGDITALAEVLSGVLTDDLLAARFGTAAFRYVSDNLSWQHQSDRTLEVYQRALRLQRTTTIAIVSPYYPPKVGGVENYAHRVAHAAADEPNTRAAVITTNSSGARTTVELDGDVPVVRLGAWLRLSNTPLSPLWPLQMRYWLRRLGVDVLNLHSPVPGLADIALLTAGQRSTVLTYHAGSMRKGSRLADSIITPYERHILPWMLARADVVVPVSPTSLAAGSPHAVLITPGVDTTLFTPGPPPSQRAPTILYVGRIDRSSAWKGLKVLLRAFAILDAPGAKLLIVGGGDAVDHHRSCAEQLGISDRVRFTGELRGSDLVKAMQDAAALVLPSLSPAESFGMVIVEAMACRTPVVGSAVGGIPHIITDEATGLLVPPGDHAALAAACQRLLVDPRLADQLGEAGHELAITRYAWPHLTDRYLGVFASLSKQARSTSRAQPRR
jgi:glycosyltransferase involved in cell wall biosynthesis